MNPFCSKPFLTNTRADKERRPNHARRSPVFERFLSQATSFGLPKLTRSRASRFHRIIASGPKIGLGLMALAILFGLCPLYPWFRSYEV